MVFLDENYTRRITTAEGDYIKFKEKETEQVKWFPFEYFDGEDDSLYRKNVLSQMPASLQIAYKYRIGEEIRRIEKSEPGRKWYYRMAFITYPSVYELGGKIKMLVKDENGEDTIVKGDFRMSNHTESMDHWARYLDKGKRAHPDFGVNVIVNNNRIDPMKELDKNHPKVEIWEYHATTEDTEKIVKLYKYCMSGNVITKEGCDKIMGVSPEPVRAGTDIIDKKQWQFKSKEDTNAIMQQQKQRLDREEVERYAEEKRKSDITNRPDLWKFSMNDIDNVDMENVYRDNRNNLVFPTLAKYNRSFAYDDKKGCFYLINSKGNIVYKKPYEITERMARAIRKRLFEEKLRRAFREAFK